MGLLLALPICKEPIPTSASLLNIPYFGGSSLVTPWVTPCATILSPALTVSVLLPPPNFPPVTGNGETFSRSLTQMRTLSPLAKVPEYETVLFVTGETLSLGAGGDLD
jgi:hypothetical protein